MKSPKIKGIGEVVTEYGAKVMKVIKKGLLGRSLFDFYGDIKANALRVKESSSVPLTPNDKDGGVVYVKNSDGKLYYKSNEVSEVELSAHTGLSTEEVQDIAGALVATGGTKTGIAVTYQDATGDVDFVIDHDAATNFVAAEHVDWAASGAGTIHTDNYVENVVQTTVTGSSGTVTSIGNLTGDVTSSNRATTIAADAVTYAKMQNVSATNVVLGRDSAGAGIVEEISAANLRTIINVEDGATADQTNVTGTAATVTAGAQPAITSLGTLSTLTVDNITVNGDSITSSGDLDIVATGNDINVDTDNFTITSATGIKPSLTLKATISNNKPSVLEFVKDKGIAGADGDYIADIYYTSDNDAQEQTNFVLIQGTVSDATDGAEEGKYNVRIKNTSSGFPVDSFILEGNGANTDATIGYGTGSVTTIAGVIELGNASDTTIARSGAGIITVEGKQVFTTNTPALTSAAAGVPAVTMQVRRTITTAEANSMNSTPIVLVPAQGANTVIVPLGGMVRVDRASAQNSSLADWNCHYESLEPGTVGVSSLMHIRRFMYGQTVDTVYHVIPSLTYNETGQNLTNDVNKALEVSFDSATTSNCFTSIEVYMTYQVFNIA